MAEEPQVTFTVSQLLDKLEQVLTEQMKIITTKLDQVARKLDEKASNVRVEAVEKRLVAVEERLGHLEIINAGEEAVTRYKAALHGAILVIASSGVGALIYLIVTGGH